MQVIIKTKNIILDSSLENLIQKRMASTQKMISAFQADTNLTVEIEKETGRHHKKGDVFKAEAMVNLPGRKLVARAHGENIGKTITSIRDELLREVRKYKTKVIELPRRKYRKIKKEII